MKQTKFFLTFGTSLHKQKHPIAYRHKYFAKLLTFLPPMFLILKDHFCKNSIETTKRHALSKQCIFGDKNVKQLLKGGIEISSDVIIDFI